MDPTLAISLSEYSSPCANELNARRPVKIVKSKFRICSFFHVTSVLGKSTSSQLSFGSHAYCQPKASQIGLVRLSAAAACYKSQIDHRQQLLSPTPTSNFSPMLPRTTLITFLRAPNNFPHSVASNRIISANNMLRSTVKFCPARSTSCSL